MRHIIPDWDGPNTGFEIVGAVSYVDTVELYWWKPIPADLLGALRREYRKRLRLRAYTKHRRGRRRGEPARPIKRCVLTIHQPKAVTLMCLHNSQQKMFSVYAVHIAIDFLCRTAREARLAKAFLARGLLIKWHGRRRANTEVDTDYSSWNRKVSRNSALHPRQSKTGRGPSAHLEFRFTSAAACRRAGLDRLIVLASGRNAMTLLERQARVAFISRQSLKRILERQAFKIKSSNRRRYEQRTVTGIEKRLERTLWRVLQDGTSTPDERTVFKVRSQDIYDNSKRFRRCLTKRIAWQQFTPTPQWYRWI